MKKVKEFMRNALIGIASHKLRSFLTILGVVIGVAAVIALMSVGKGVEANIVSSIQALGSNMLFISPGSTSQGGVRAAAGSATTLTLEDAKAIASEIANVNAAAPSTTSMSQVVYSGSNARTRIVGITPDYQQAMNLEVTEGDFIYEQQYQSALKVAVLGPTVKKTLFGEEGDAVGQQVKAGNVVLKVVGVLGSKGTSMMGSTDDAVLIPLTTLGQTMNISRTSQGYTSVNQITVSVSDKQYMASVQAEISELLRTRHKLSDIQDNDFTITSQEDIIKTFTQATGSMTVLLGAIAAISLLVGGIGVMNIMLVSVIERTREIGVRKALGAMERDIWMQFLAEAGLLTFSGGIIGVITGVLASEAISKFGSMSTMVSWEMVVMAVSVSIGIGLFFGFYPAWSASRLNPIEALRSE